MKVVIIGAGAAGLGIGWRLAQAGAKVTVLERAQVGNGATSASGGMIATAVDIGEPGSPQATLARRAADLWPAFAAELERESRVEIGYRKSGALIVRMKGDDVLPALGAPAEVLDAAQARAMEPGLGENIAEAIWAPDEALVDSQALCRALAVSLVRAGGEVLSNETVVRFEHDGSRVTGVRTPFTTHHADVYILAAGAWSSRLEGLPPDVVPPIAPVKGELVVLAPQESAPLPSHFIWGNGVYLIQRRGRLLVGATTELAGFDTSVSHAAASWLYRQATTLMPSLADWRQVQHWAGLRPASPDGMPILGESRLEGLYIAGGQYRNGILFAPAIAEGLSRLVMKREVELSAFNPKRFGAGAPGAAVVETPHRDAGAGEWRTGS